LIKLPIFIELEEYILPDVDSVSILVDQVASINVISRPTKHYTRTELVRMAIMNTVAR
jgi:hypothetical protein